MAFLFICFFCFKKGSYIALANLEYIQISVCFRLLKLKEPPPPVILFIFLFCFIEIGFHCVCGDGLRLGAFWFTQSSASLVQVNSSLQVAQEAVFHPRMSTFLS